MHMEFGPSWKQIEVNLEILSKNDRILVLIGGLFANNFALVHYSKLKFLHNVDIIMYVMDRIWNLVHHENKLKLILKYCQKWPNFSPYRRFVCE